MTLYYANQLRKIEFWVFNLLTLSESTRSEWAKYTVSTFIFSTLYCLFYIHLKLFLQQLNFGVSRHQVCLFLLTLTFKLIIIIVCSGLQALTFCNLTKSLAWPKKTFKKMLYLIILFLLTFFNRFFVYCMTMKMFLK